ncbi:hypothetical protein [Pantoea sp. OXWO6B1]|uniref:hypothetical protein n=1 Tax=Pantoea sp. OXWO6B1 TaxID=1835724 RepID=UPI0007C7E342|nr:hypothetical protein [Pantoea sp. OXWO6B1]OAD97812.1 hypothetical protein A6A26_21665 [Pantoea sp. OXWO6B1]
MNSWLVSWQEEVGSTSHEYHMLLQGSDFALAEAACERMGENWWPPERPVCSQGCYWQFDRGSVWLKSIVLLDEREADTLTGLRFLDEWAVSGTPDAPVICDRCDCRWEDYWP